MLITHKFFIDHFRFVRITGQYLSLVRFGSTLANQMKRLNDEKKFERVLELYDTYHKENNPRLLPAPVVVQALKACMKINDLQRAKAIHDRLSSSHQRDPYIVSSLIDFYMQSGDVQTAELLFRKLKSKELPVYGIMMKGYTRNNQASKTIDLFHEINKPNDIIFILLFQACAQLGNKEALNLIQSTLKKIPPSFYLNPRLLTSLIDALLKCDDVQTAEIFFDKVKVKNIPMYGAMMKGYVKCKQINKAIELFQQIKEPNDVIFMLMFQARAQLETKEALNLIQSFLTKMPISFYSDLRRLTSLIDTLVECGDVKRAEEFFTKATVKDLPIYGAMMKGYVKSKQLNKAIDLFHQINEPDVVIFILMFQACAQLGTKEASNLIQSLLTKMPISFCSDRRLLTSLIDTLAECGDVKRAEEFFTKATVKDLPIYGAMMKGYVKSKQINKAIDLFHQINEPDVVIFILMFQACAQLGTKEASNLIQSLLTKMPISFCSDRRLLTSLIDALVECGDVERAEEFFTKATVKDLPIYGAMMKGYTQNDMPKKTVELFDEIKKRGLFEQVSSPTKCDSVNETNLDHYEVSLIIYLLTINALARLYDLSLSESIIKDIPTSILSHRYIRDALIDMWGKIGCIDKAKQVYEKGDQDDPVRYTTMINSYGLNGMGVEAVELFEQMPQQLIEERTRICVLNACSHSGLVHQARAIFSSVPVKTERIYTTMIDCMSRTSQFEEAQQLIEQYEQEHPSDPVMYMALLSAARNNKNGQLAEKIYNRMKKLFPQLKHSWVSASVLLANTYSSLGDMGKATDIKIELAQSGLKKKSGRSWTRTTTGKYYEFRAHDTSHPRSSEIYAELERISKQLMEHGHEYDRSSITRPIAAHETIETVLCGHSERLAIAWNFVEDPNAKLIRVGKNLRVCGDCHRATKLIAAIRQCEISVRDANRIHHFNKNGTCSCNDHF